MMICKEKIHNKDIKESCHLWWVLLIIILNVERHLILNINILIQKSYEY